MQFSREREKIYVMKFLRYGNLTGIVVELHSLNVKNSKQLTVYVLFVSFWLNQKLLVYTLNYEIL